MFANTVFPPTANQIQLSALASLAFTDALSSLVADLTPFEKTSKNLTVSVRGRKELTL